ncbi:hypothetical protein [Xanthomonas axonopodis]|uniref:hypothetical protein n=1 Tax=Xanthomonas axonopodis TaxID=53413 RepID=UPI0015E2B280|nr:hypothetical protein [Xanthomonas axonopodis]
MAVEDSPAALAISATESACFIFIDYKYFIIEAPWGSGKAPDVIAAPISKVLSRIKQALNKEPDLRQSMKNQSGRFRCS